MNSIKRKHTKIEEWLEPFILFIVFRNDLFLKKKKKNLGKKRIYAFSIENLFVYNCRQQNEKFKLFTFKYFYKKTETLFFFFLFFFKLKLTTVYKIIFYYFFLSKCKERFTTVMHANRKLNVRNKTRNCKFFYWQ